MKRITSIKVNQNGVGLLEALIAVALSSIVILGAVYSTGRMLGKHPANTALPSDPISLNLVPT